MLSFAKRRSAHIRLGEKGERLARRLVINLGMEILARNYRGPHGEIDLIARDGVALCFIEVKTRRYSKRSRPADAVTLEKNFQNKTARPKAVVNENGSRAPLFGVKQRDPEGS